MRYLGGISGFGSLKCGGETMARAEYAFDGFLSKTGQITGSGEIRLVADALSRVFGRRDIKLLTEDGRLLGLYFSGKQLPPAAGVAHVDVVGDLPRPSEWRYGGGSSAD